MLTTAFDGGDLGVGGARVGWREEELGSAVWGRRMVGCGGLLYRLFRAGCFERARVRRWSRSKPPRT